MVGCALCLGRGGPAYNAGHSQRIGVFGGTFDPIHLGHLITVEDARSQLKLDRVLFVPNRRPPHKTDQNIASVEDRLSMVRLAIDSNPAFNLDLTEIERMGPSYALDTMRTLRDRYGAGVDLVFILGLDALLGLCTWHEPEALLAEFDLAVLSRAAEGATDAGNAMTALRLRFPNLDRRLLVLDVPQIAISASNIRARVKDGRTIRYQVPLAVEEYIRERRLYGGG